MVRHRPHAWPIPRRILEPPAATIVNTRELRGQHMRHCDCRQRWKRKDHDSGNARAPSRPGRPPGGCRRRGYESESGDDAWSAAGPNKGDRGAAANVAETRAAGGWLDGLDVPPRTRSRRSTRTHRGSRRCTIARDGRGRSRRRRLNVRRSRHGSWLSRRAGCEIA